MKISVICGSHRNVGSYKASQFIQHLLQDKGIETEAINIADENIPLRTEDRRNPNSQVSKNLESLRKKLIDADGFVTISPERGGMVPPGLKNFFLIASDKHEFAHKPSLLVGVSSGTGGSYPIAELRMSSYKNSKINHIPDHVIVRDIESVLNNFGMNEDEDDIRIKNRIDRSLDMLILYTKASKNIRENKDIDIHKHAYGM